jgi:hypothetical protein
LAFSETPDKSNLRQGKVTFSKTQTRQDVASRLRTEMSSSRSGQSDDTLLAKMLIALEPKHFPVFLN